MIWPREILTHAELRRSDAKISESRPQSLLKNAASSSTEKDTIYATKFFIQKFSIFKGFQPSKHK